MSNFTPTSEEILACARSLIVSGGYNGFSYADISEVVGIRKASIHHHFPTKADLVRTLVSRYREDAQATVARMQRDTPDPRDQLRNYVGYWKGCIADASRPFCVCALLAGELPALPPDVAIEVRGYFQLLSAWLTSAFERGAELGFFTLSHAPRVEAEMFMATVHGAMLSARAYGDAEIFGLITGPLLERLSPRN
ncbi:TetR/AcrR family transcriptional regulator [Bosea caraganae]|uniref:TetR/AcrR family transcriptional regulator n=1 Tax=Bosea caraganae TaxID=2763117 RepID=A0A370KXG2_9HYPH|nr:TetR/AcrR family transcriptional regulator [Bosea caraganae]RDJ19661.1 TetR/AcrR family transcriptional regulator [Bosea caraganae]RDJ24319.1 TetR/AcrR family transcriptional regulator [Bosea caraganae]